MRAPVREAHAHTHVQAGRQAGRPGGAARVRATRRWLHISGAFEGPGA